jgi:hypothetical protein
LHPGKDRSPMFFRQDREVKAGLANRECLIQLFQRTIGLIEQWLCEATNPSAMAPMSRSLRVVARNYCQLWRAEGPCAGQPRAAVARRDSIAARTCCEPIASLLGQAGYASAMSLTVAAWRPPRQ